MPAIVAEALTKTYRYHRKAPGLRGSLASLVRRESLQTRAVDGISFAIESGEVVGFLGPNGAGKTTTLKMLCGLLYPSGGHAAVLGHTPARRERAYLRRVALVMGQKNMLWWDIPAMETLLLHKEMYEIPAPEFRRSLDELSTMLDVGHLLNVQVRKLSLGERMKMELLTALIHRPQVLFLDEPTIGLDVVSQGRVRDFLRRLNRERGTTILLTSHYMDDIEALCPRVLVIDHGRLRFDGPLSALVERMAPHKRLSLVFAEAQGRAAALAALDGRAYDLLDEAGDALTLRLSLPRDDVPEVTGYLLRVASVVDVSVEEAPIDEIIREVFTGAEPAGSGV